jgi:hypothetical protein
VLSAVIKTIESYYRKRAVQRYGKFQEPLKIGAVTVCQRSGDALNLNLHLHSLVTDGVYTISDNPKFYPVHAPSDADVMAILKKIVLKVKRIADKHTSTLAQENLGAPINNNFGKIRTHFHYDEPELSGRRCATYEHFSIHANTAVSEHNRVRLETLSRYLLRPPVSLERLSLPEDGKTVIYKLKKTWSDGTSHVTFTPQQFLSRLCNLVQPPYSHQIRFHGVLAPNSKIRKMIVPRPMSPMSIDEMEALESKTPKRIRLSWADLLKRVFLFDIEKCPKCQGKMKIIAAITETKVIAKYLSHIGLPTGPPEIVPALTTFSETEFIYQ